MQRTTNIPGGFFLMVMRGSVWRMGSMGAEIIDSGGKAKCYLISTQ
jgi:hypothetical protein